MSRKAAILANKANYVSAQFFSALNCFQSHQQFPKENTLHRVVSVAAIKKVKLEIQ